MKKIYLFLAFSFMLVQLSFAQAIPPKYEFRGAWIATISNSDWPSSFTESSGEQISELVTMFNKLKDAGINAVFFQIRTGCDAIYNSPLEPWAHLLTGEQGKAPDPSYDPLEFAIDEAHRRGMELHAWINPYRAANEENNYPLAKDHISITHPDWILQFDKYKMLDPGNPDVQDYIVNIIKDVLTRYDIDGVHFDDFFYPYSHRITNEDSLSFEKYKGNFTNVEDWRRNNVNTLVSKVYDMIKKIKPKVKFGISPFGVVKNSYVNTNALESYSRIYCDPLVWIKNKTVDYIAPQLYWEMDFKKAPYRKLLPWWASVTKGVHLYIGHWASRFCSPDYKGSKTEIIDQINLNRETSNVSGSVFYNARSIRDNYGGLADTLKNYFYKYPALTPPMPWKDNIPPNAPNNLIGIQDSTGIVLYWDKPETAADSDNAYQYVVYRFSQSDEINLNDPRFIVQIMNASKTKFRDTTVFSEGTNLKYIVTALDRLHNESIPSNQVEVVYSIRKTD